MKDRILEALDRGTVAFFASTGAHFATVNLDLMLSRVLLVLSIALGLGKLFEMLTGRKLRTLWRNKKGERE